jgi:predicted nucleic acid-binding protein
MSSAHAVDASVAVKLYLVEPLSAEATSLFAGLTTAPAADLHVPGFFYLECANIFWKQVQRGNCTPTQATAFEAALRSLLLRRTPTADLSADALALALAHGLTAYDACYVALAVRLGLTLVTADQRLERKLAGTSLPVVWLGQWTPPTTGP